MNIENSNFNHDKTDKAAVHKIKGFLVDTLYPTMTLLENKRSKSLNHFKEFKHKMMHKYCHNIDIVKEEDIEEDLEIFNIFNYKRKFSKNKNINKSKEFETRHHINMERLPINLIALDEDFITSEIIKNKNFNNKFCNKNKIKKCSLKINEDLINTHFTVREEKDEYKLEKFKQHSPRLKIITDLIEDSFLSDLNPNSTGNDSLTNDNSHYMSAYKKFNLNESGENDISEMSLEFEEELVYVDNTQSNFKIINVTLISDKLEDSFIENAISKIHNFSSKMEINLHNLNQNFVIKEEIKEEELKISLYGFFDDFPIVDEIDDLQKFKKSAIINFTPDFCKIDESDEF